jgi:hypothetical protein
MTESSSSVVKLAPGPLPGTRPARGGQYRGGQYRGGQYRDGQYRGGQYRGGQYRDGMPTQLVGFYLLWLVFVNC